MAIDDALRLQELAQLKCFWPVRAALIFLNHFSHFLINLHLLDVRPGVISRNSDALKYPSQIHFLLLQLIKLLVLELEDELAVATQHILEDAAETPNVNAIRVAFVEEELWRHEPDGAYGGYYVLWTALNQFVIVDCVVEVRDFDESLALIRLLLRLCLFLLRIIIIPQNVCRLHVSMDDGTLLMQILQAFGDLFEYLLDLCM